MEIKQDYNQEILRISYDLTSKLINDAQEQWQEMYAKRTDITPAKAKQLAREYVTLFLAQELQFRISKSMNTDK